MATLSSFRLAEMTEHYRDLGWEVWGVENSPEACPTANLRLNGLVKADLNDMVAVRRGLDEGGVHGDGEVGAQVRTPLEIGVPGL